MVTMRARAVRPTVALTACLVLVVVVVFALTLSRPAQASNEDCVFTAGGSTFDLSQLKKAGDFEVRNARYSVDALVAICGPISTTIVGCHNAVSCLRDFNEENPRPAGDGTSEPTFELLQADDPEFGARLTYNAAPGASQADALKVEFALTCGVGLGEPVFFSMVDDVALFQWATEAMCVGEAPVSDEACQVTDPKTGNEYDLSPLTRTKFNWLAADTIEDSHYRYEINVCAPVVQLADFEGTDCADEGTAICRSRWTAGGDYTESESLGWSARPVFVDGVLQIDTSFGTDCDAGYANTATIQFICDVNAGSGHPVLREVSDDCTYIFDWRSSVACPVHDEFGGDCIVTDVATGVTYDLRSLNENHGFYTYSSDDYDFYFNICGDLQHTNNKECDGIGMCQVSKNDGETYKLGSSNTNLTLSHDILSLRYEGGDQCGSSLRRQTIVIFLCHEKETPSFTVVETSTCVYVIEFQTKLACENGDDLVECLATDPITGEQYDLSSLRKLSGGSNHAVQEKGGAGAKILFNVCGPLVYETAAAACPIGSAVCGLSGIPKRDDNVVLGVASEPEIEDGVLYINYDDDGSGCGSTTIAFHCNDEEDAPSLLSVSSGGCNAIIQWHTPAACPLNTERGAHCAVTNPLNNQALDFSSLAGSVRRLEVGSTTFYVHLCGTLPGTIECAVNDNGACLSNSDTGESHGLGQASDAPFILDDSIFFKYPTGHPCDEGNGLTQTVIEMVCDPALSGAEDAALSFVERVRDTCSYQFEWRTRLACRDLSPETHPPHTTTTAPAHTDPAETTTPDSGGGDFKPVYCKVEGENGETYDLSLLQNDDSNWFVAGNHNDFFELNICRPITDDIGDACSAARDGACQRTTDGSFSLGVPSAPKWDPLTKNVYFLYENGDFCESAQKARTTRINFVCDYNARPGTLVFTGETNTCEYEFSWVTESACPVSHNNGLGCAVEHPVTGDLYNLTALIKPEGYTIHETSYDFVLSVCTPLADKCAGESSAGACQRSTDGSGREFSLGTLADQAMESPQIDQQSGAIYLEYLGGTECEQSGSFRTTRVTFECDENIENAVPEFIGETAACVYEFNFKTKYACPLTEQSARCKADGFMNGRLVEYDLAPLIHPRRNWLVDYSNADNRTISYLLNVCRPVLNGVHECRPNSGACKVVNGFEYADVDLGESGYPSVNDDGSLVLRYEHGDYCRNNTQRRTATVEMVCPRAHGSAQAGVIGNPVFISETECETLFQWVTSYACPLQAFPGGNCKITDIQTGQTFDLSSLHRANGYSAQFASGDAFNFNICGAASTCSGNQGACTSSTSYGEQNGNLFFKESSVALEYKHGSTCDKEAGESTYRTLIQFVCDPSLTTPRIRLGSANEDTCTVVVFVSTQLACHQGEQVECVVRDDDTGVEYDLSSLSNHDTNYFVSDEREDHKYTYAINVCRTLVPLHDYPDCDPQSAVCQLSYSNNQFLEKNLGDVGSPQFQDGELFIKYENGDLCGSFPRETYIYFVCGEGVGYPVFVSELLCTYNFVWRTAAACAPSQEPSQDSGECQVTDPVTFSTYDLRPLSGRTAAATSIPSSASSITMSVCGATQCSGNHDGEVGICMDRTVSLGQPSQSPVETAGVVHLDYKNGDVCRGNVRYSAEIVFICSSVADDDTSAPVFQDVTPDGCHYVFKWYTTAACRRSNVISCLLRDIETGNSYDLSVLTRDAGEDNWKVFDVRDGGDTYEYEVNICRDLNRPVDNDPQDKCRGSAVCQTKPGDESFQNKPVGRLNDPPSLARGSLQLQYSMEGIASSECGGSPRTAIFTFTCLPGRIGEPIFDYEDNCKYYFIWETEAACPLQKTIGSQCKVTDAVSLLTYDFRIWADDVGSLQVPLGHGESLHIAVCGAVTCGQVENTGACKFDQDGKPLSLGVYNEALTYSNNQLLLHYRQGSECASNPDEKYSIVISFVCDDQRVGNETLVRLVGCTYYYTWFTGHACARHREVPCLVSDPASGYAYDLTPLQKSQETDSNWVVDVFEQGHEFDYILNVCHSLNDQTPPTGCDDTAGVCQITGDRRFNLGGVSSPIIDTDGNLVLQYINGDAIHCPAGTVRRTIITFECKEAGGLGAPRFDHESDDKCLYYFTWASSAACPVRTPDIGHNCGLHETALHPAFNLHELENSVLEGSDGTNSFKLSVCGPLAQACGDDDDAGICMTTPSGEHLSLGDANNELYIRDNSLFYLKFINGDECGMHAKYSSEVRFICSCAFEALIPEKETEESCLRVFNLYTSHRSVCGNECGGVQPTLPPPSASSGSKSVGIAIGSFIGVLVVAALVYFVVRRRRRTNAFQPLSISADDFEDDDETPLEL